MARFTLPELPYAIDALAPAISRETLEFHWGKHHQTYVNNLNNLVEGTDWAEKSLEDIILGAEGGLFKQRRAGIQPHLLLVLDDPAGRR